MSIPIRCICIQHKVHNFAPTWLDIQEWIIDYMFDEIFSFVTWSRRYSHNSFVGSRSVALYRLPQRQTCIGLGRRETWPDLLGSGGMLTVAHVGRTDSSICCSVMGSWVSDKSKTLLLLPLFSRNSFSKDFVLAETKTRCSVGEWK